MTAIRKLRLLGREFERAGAARTPFPLAVARDDTGATVEICSLFGQPDAGTFAALAEAADELVQEVAGPLPHELPTAEARWAAHVFHLVAHAQPKGGVEIINDAWAASATACFTLADKVEFLESLFS